MPRGKQLSEYEKGQIDAFKAAGLSNRQIAEKIKRSPRVVNNYRSNPLNYGTRKRSGRPEKLKQQEKKRIINAASNSTKYSTEIKRELNLPVTPRTVRNVIKRSGVIVRAKMKPAPALTDAHKAKRLDFCRKNLQMDWSKVGIFYFSDC